MLTHTHKLHSRSTGGGAWGGEESGGIWRGTYCIIFPLQKRLLSHGLHNTDDDSESSTSNFDKSKSYSRSARRRVGGARDRYIYGELNDAAVGCQEGLVCVRVDGGKSECQPENTNGTSLSLAKFSCVAR